ncbi:MAG TPA: signal peptidase II [Pirellulaceae bacterium]|nr:signal peptidase II [Pirellulaceae bacterium]
MKPGQQLADSPNTAAAAGPMINGVPVNRHLIYFFLALAGCATDLVTKEVIFRWRGLPGQKGIVWLVEGYVGIETALNRGALFGMGAGGSRYFAYLAIGAVIGVVAWLFLLRAARDRLLTVALGIISGGILGNLYDRLGLWDHGPLPAAMQNLGYETAVRDWILWCWNFKQFTWPNFNIADSLLVCGAGLLLWHAFMMREPKRE